MGHQLTREIMAGAPADWTPAMRLVAVAVADQANDRTRRTIGYRVEGYERRNGQWRDGVCEHTGLSPREVRRVLARLAEAGLELRVAIGKDKAGRPMYACKGRGCDYSVPTLPPRERRSPVTAKQGERRSPVTANTPAMAVTGDRPSPHTDPLNNLSPQRSAGAAAPLLIVTDRAHHREEGTMPTPRHRKSDPSPDQSALWPAAMPGETSTRNGAGAGTVAVRAPGFDDFWRAYPRRVAKGAARKAWEAKVVKEHADPALVVAGAERYAGERAGQDPRFTKHPATWLRAECWDDEPVTAGLTPVQALRATLSAPDQNVLDHLALAAEYRAAGEGR